MVSSSTWCASATAQTVKLGVIATLSGPQALFGRETVDALNLAIKHLDGKLGGLKPELLVIDDQFRPEPGRTAAERLVKRDQVDFITGIASSAVMLAVADTILKDPRQIFVVNSIAGPSSLAGKDCHPNFFSVSWQNDNLHEAMGAYMTKKGIKRAYILAPNYPAGKDSLAGFKRFFKGEVVGEVYTQLTQTDYAAEIATLRAAKPESTYIFYPGGTGIAFTRQYAQAGLMQQIPLYAPGTSLDQTTIPSIGNAVLGTSVSLFWAETMKNPANERFVKDYEATYKRIPSEYAAQAYDAAMLMDSAIKAVKGDLSKKDELRNALKAAKFNSVRGAFKFNNNHFPIQNYYLGEIVKDSSGRLVNEIRSEILRDHGDAYAKECSMK
jgi:branched-chain amino acid transport system substrate-binding protein